MSQKFNPLAIAWLVVVILVSGFAISLGGKFDSSLMTLLPKSEQQPIVQAATEQMADRFSKRLLLLVSAEDENTVRKAIPLLASQMRKLPEISKIDWRVSDDEIELLQNELYPYRFSVLDHTIRALLLDNDFQQIQARALMRLYSPLSIGKTSLVEDPFSLFSELNQNRKNNLKITVSNSLLKITSASKPTYLMMLTLSEQPFSPTLQRNILGAIASQDAALKETGVTIQMSGMLLHAELGARQANREILTIGIGSMIGIMVLMLVVFRKFKPIGLMFIPILVGCVMAASATMFIFGKIHLITVAFGAGLVGVSIDYSLHFLCERQVSAAKSVLQKILPGLLLGLFSSVMAFTAQALSPFPGLQQMAVFSVVGLSASWLTVVLWYPFFTRNDSIKPLAAAERLNNFRNVFPRVRENKVLIVIILIMVIWSLNTIKNSESLDDIRLLQTSPASLLAQEKDIQQLLGSSSSSQFLLVSGDTLEACLQKEEEITPLLDHLISEGLLNGYQSLTQKLPSLKRQGENRVLVQQLYEQQLAPFYDKIHLADDKVLEALAALEEDSQYLQSEQWFQQKNSKPWQDLRVISDNKTAITIRFTGNISEDTKAALIALSDKKDDVEFIDQVQNISNLMTSFRSEITGLILGAYFLVFLVLLARYKTQVWRIILPPLLASIFTLALLVHLEQGLNLFHLMALILVLGIGLDMGIFLSESSDCSHTWLAVSLSSFTSLLAFGLLAFSDTPVLHHFGLTVLIGLTLVWLLAPIMRDNIKKEGIDGRGTTTI